MLVMCAFVNQVRYSIIDIRLTEINSTFWACKR